MTFLRQEVDNQTRGTAKRMLITQTGEYHDIKYRPYQTDVQPDVTDIFLETIDDNQGSIFVTTEQLSGVAGSIIRPSAVSHGDVNIENGWEQPRARFFLELEFENAGHVVTEGISGYTDHYGVDTRILQCDPEMRLYFNSNIIARNSHSRRPDGSLGEMTYAITEAAHIITPQVNGSFRSGFNAEANSLLRPSDLFSYLQLENSEIPSISQNARTNDFRNIAGSLGVSKSRRVNGIAADYLSRSINAVSAATFKAAEPQALLIGGEASGLYTNARNREREPVVNKDMFIKQLTLYTNYSANGYITYRELCSLFPNIPDVTGISVASGPVPVNREYSAELSGSGQELVIATILSSAIPAALVNCGLSAANFTVHNHTVNGQVDIELFDIRSIMAVDLRLHGDMFMDKVANEIFPDVSYFGQVSLDIAMQADLSGNSFISISYDGYPAMDFNIPTFADALFSPIITPDRSIIQNVAHDIAVLANTVSNATPDLFTESQLGREFNQPKRSHRLETRGHFHESPRKTNFGL